MYSFTEQYYIMLYIRLTYNFDGDKLNGVRIKFKAGLVVYV